MNSLKDVRLRDNHPFVNKTIFWDSFGSDSTTPNYRIIPVNKTIDAMKVTGIPIENVCGFKDLGKISSFSNSNTFIEANSNTFIEAISNTFSEPIPCSSTRTNMAKQTPKKEIKKPINSFQHVGDSVNSFLDRQEKGSCSEPTLPVANDCGDTCREEMGAFQNDVRQPSFPKKRTMKGCMYIKHAGIVYKSIVEAKKLQTYEKDIFQNFPPCKKLSLSTGSKNVRDKSVFKKNGLNLSTDEIGDFEIAIYLSGLMTSDEKHQKHNGMEFGKVQRDESKVQHERIKKKKKSHDSKSNALHGKSFDTVSQGNEKPVKVQKIKKHKSGTSSRYKTRLAYQINNPDVALGLSADDSDEEYILDEMGNIISMKKEKEELEDYINQERDSLKQNDSGGLSFRSRKSFMSSKSKLASQSTVAGFSDVCGIPKSKITEEEMWENFEMIFKNYASTNRHSGEVIPRKISTEWMINTGVVDQIMTQKQADDAFRSVAGAKITMNANEYKNFLISLSLKMKRPYYEIYRRMCGM